MGTLTDLFRFYKPVAHESNYEDDLNPNWDTLEAIFAGTPFDIRTEGAACDGSTDDSDAIDATLEKLRWYQIGPGFSGATMPNALQGSAGGTVWLPPGVTCISRTIAPDQRGGTDLGGSSDKAISFVGSGFSNTRLKWIGASTTDPMLELGTDGAGNNSNNSSEEGAVVRGIRFDGGGIASTGVHLLECTNTVVEDNAFGGQRDHGVLSDADPLSGHDYGGINLTIQRNYFGWRSAIGSAAGHVGIGLKCSDAHALIVQGNEFSNCRHGNLHIAGGGGNMKRLLNNSFEGVGLTAQTDAGGPYHSVYLDAPQGTLLAGNAWEDDFTQATTPDCRPLYIAGGGDYTVISNTFYNAGNYIIEVKAGLGSFQGLQLIGNQEYSSARTATVKIPTDAGGVYSNMYAAGNTGFLYEDPSGRMVIGPHSGHRGFTKMVVGAYDPVTGYDVPRDGSTLDVRGSLFHDGVIEGIEMADPSAPSANRGKLYYRDNGSGKTQLCVRFSSGAVQVIATEP